MARQSTFNTTLKNNAKLKKKNTKLRDNTKLKKIILSFKKNDIKLRE